MAPRSLFVTLLTVVAGSLALEGADSKTALKARQAGVPNYTVSMGSISADDFCQQWRDAAVGVAAQTCHHHEISCDPGSNGQAQARAGMVPFRNNPEGQCNTSEGPASSPVTDTTYQVVGWLSGQGVRVLSVNGSPAPAQAPASPSPPPPPAWTPTTTTTQWQPTTTTWQPPSSSSSSVWQPNTNSSLQTFATISPLTLDTPSSVEAFVVSTSTTSSSSSSVAPSSSTTANSGAAHLGMGISIFTLLLHLF